MDILDKHFIALPVKKKVFIVSIGFSFFLIAIAAYQIKMATLVESFLLFIVGLLLSEMIKLEYRIIDLETINKKNNKKKNNKK